MKKVLFSFVLFSSVVITNAQSLSPEVIASAGDFFESAVGSLSWTLGEPVTETLENNQINVILTQGFQQPWPEDVIIGVRNIPVFEVSAVLYPNPTAQQIRMDLTYDHSSEIRIELIDMLGRVLNAENLDVVKGQLTNYNTDVSSLAAGTYMFRLTDKGNVMDTYKFQKVGY